MIHTEAYKDVYQIEKFIIPYHRAYQVEKAVLQGMIDEMEKEVVEMQYSLHDNCKCLPGYAGFFCATSISRMDEDGLNGFKS